MDSTALELPSHLQSPLRWIVKALDTWTGRDAYRMGGGSVLAARWRHRHSTDIDLFFDEVAHSEMPLTDMFDAFLALEKQGEIHGLEIHSGRGFLFHKGDVPLSFFATRPTTPSPISEQNEATTGIATESSAEILLKKIRARMIRGSNYLSRDAYDLVVAHLEDPGAVDVVFRQLRPEERSILSYDAQNAAFRLINDYRILSPSYPRLVNPTGNLEQLTCEALARELSKERVQEFRRVARDLDPPQT